MSVEDEETGDRGRDARPEKVCDKDSRGDEVGSASGVEIGTTVG